MRASQSVPTPHVTRLWRALALFVPLSLLGNLTSAALRYPETGAAVLYAPYAVLTAALVASRRRDWHWFVSISVAVHAAAHWPGWSPSWILGANVANVARALCAALLLRRLLGAAPRLTGVAALARFVAVAVVLAPALGAGVGALNVVLHRAPGTYWQTWNAWFVSNALTGMTLLPALLAAFRGVTRRRLGVKRERAAEAALLGLALAATCVFAFLAPAGHWRLPLPFYAPLPVLIWAALRFGSTGASLSLSVASVAATLGAARGSGPFFAADPEQAVLALQLYVVLTALPVLCIAAVDGARRREVQLHHALLASQRRAQRALEEQQRELSHLARVAMLGQLSGALAHELNQPLTAILANANAARRLLELEPLDRVELREIVQDIAGEDRRAADVIQRLRDFFQRGEVRLQALDAAALVAEVLELARGELVTRGVVPTASLEPDLPPVHADRVQLQQVLLNLVLNACEAMSGNAAAERPLSLTLVRENGHAHLAVRDRGTGIAPALLERVFDPFVTTKPEGLGLGLSISRTIVRAHGGTLWAENNSDRGATVHCLLPLAEPRRRASA